jgi:hypothetical protein
MASQISIGTGLMAFWSSFRFMRVNNMRGWGMAFAITIMIVWAGVAFAWWHSLTQLRDTIWEASELEQWRIISEESEIPFWSLVQEYLKMGLSSGLNSLSHLLVALFVFALNLKVTKYIVLASLGPLIALLSEKASSRLKSSGEEQVGLRMMVKGLVRGVKSALLMFTVELGVGAALVSLSFLISVILPFFAPVLAFLLPLALVATGSWFYGAAMFDCIWERKGLSGREGLVCSRRIGTSVLGLGLPIYLLMTLPFLALPIGLIVGPIGGAVGAVLIEARLP